MNSCPRWKKKELDIPEHIHSPETCKKLRCNHLQQDFLKKINAIKEIKADFTNVDKIDNMVNGLMMDHAFRNADPEIKSKLE